MKINTWIVFIIFIFTMSSFVMASVGERITLDNPSLINYTMNKPYDLESIDLRLPEINLEILNAKSQNKLTDLVSVYGESRSDLQDNKNYILLERPPDSGINTYRLDIENENENKDRTISLKPLPGVSVNADFNKDEEDDTVKENTNISLQYWMDNRTLIRAEYGMENKEWWDIKDIELRENNDEISNDDISNENDSINNDDESTDIDNDGSYESENPVTNYSQQELIFKEEKNQTSRLGISYQTNENVTISADYIDSTSMENDYSTIFGVEYRDEIGSLKYHYQVDFGDQPTKESGLELGYKDLATFNATYKIFDPKYIEDQLNKSIWDFGLDVNLSDISSLSFGYQFEQNKLSDQIIDKEDQEDTESNIKAQLKIKF